MLIMTGCVQWSFLYGWEDFALSRDRTQSARSVGQLLTPWATRAPNDDRIKIVIVDEVSFNEESRTILTVQIETSPSKREQEI